MDTVRPPVAGEPEPASPHDTEVARLLTRSTHLVELSLRVQARSDAVSKNLAKVIAVSEGFCREAGQLRRVGLLFPL